MLTLMVPLVVGSVALATPASADGREVRGPVTGVQTSGVVVVFGRGEQVFDVGPLPELGKAAKTKAQNKGKEKANKTAKKKSRKQTKKRTYGGWLDGYRAGFRCSVFQLFWSYVHRWNCKPVVARGQVVLSSTSTYQEKKLEALQKAIGEQHKLSDHKLGWWALNGRWVVGGIFLLMLLSGIIKRMRRRRPY